MVSVVKCGLPGQLVTLGAHEITVRTVVVQMVEVVYWTDEVMEGVVVVPVEVVHGVVGVVYAVEVVYGVEEAGDEVVAEVVYGEVDADELLADVVYGVEEDVALEDEAV